MTVELLFLILALICFVVAAFEVPSRVNLIAACLAFCVVAALVTHLA